MITLARGFAKYIVLLAVGGAMKSAFHGDNMAMAFLVAAFIVFALIQRMKGT